MVESTVCIGFAKMNPISVPTDALSTPRPLNQFGRLGWVELTPLHCMPQFTYIGGLEHFLFFHIIIGDVIIPIDETIFFRGVGQPPTSYLSWIGNSYGDLGGPQPD